MIAALDSSAIVGLLFRHDRERRKILSLIPAGATIEVSSYAIFEIARGYFANLILLYNLSRECSSFAELHERAHSGQLRFKTYRRETWLGAFDDYFAFCEVSENPISTEAMLAEFAAWLRRWIRRGWGRIQSLGTITNRAGCISHLPEPHQRIWDGLFEHEIPVNRCGRPSNCGVVKFIQSRNAELPLLADGLNRAGHFDIESRRRYESFSRLVAIDSESGFAKLDCYRCGDAIIVLECDPGTAVVTKNVKHFAPICHVTDRCCVEKLP